jgi:branched-chain amino acid transport system permease protein
VGAALITVALEFFRRVEEGADLGLFHIPQIFGLSQIGIATIFILVMIFRREGLMGRWELEELIPRFLVERRAARESRSAPATATDQQVDVIQRGEGLL